MAAAVGDRRARDCRYGPSAPRAGSTADLRALVPFEAEPVQTVEDVLLVLEAGTGLVGVLESQDEGAAGLAREQVVEQSRPGGADVQRARWGWARCDTAWS